MNKLLLPSLLALAFSPAAMAFEAGDWVIKAGVHAVDPKSDNGSLAAGALEVDVDTNSRPSLMVEYFLTDAMGLELLAAWPFKHTVELNGADAAEITHLPPTVSLQYHFNSDGKVSPFVGAGVNFTWIYDEESRGPIDGTDLDLDNSWGLALHAGVDFQVSDRWYVGVDARWIDIDTDVEVDGAAVGTVNVDPLAYGVYASYRF